MRGFRKFVATQKKLLITVCVVMIQAMLSIKKLLHINSLSDNVR